MTSTRRAGLGLLAGLGVAAAGAAVGRAARRGRPGRPVFAGAPLLIAHRGGGGLAPENTLFAFRRAVELWAADMIELDVQPTADGDAVVFHDPTLERTTDGEGRVDAHTADELRRYDAGYRFVDEHGNHAFRGQGIGISTIGEVLEALPSTRITIELKDARAQAAVARAIRDHGAERRVVVAGGRRAWRASFNGRDVPISAAREEIRRLIVLHRLRVARLWNPSVDALQVPEQHDGTPIVTPRLVADAHALNLPVHVWTVDDEADMQRLLDWGVDGLITDRPDRLARVLHERVGRPLPPALDPAAGPV